MERVCALGNVTCVDRWLCGWRVASDLPLPECLAWPGGEGKPDIAVRLGRLADRLDNLVHDGPLLQIAADSTCRYELTGVAAFRVEAGHSIIVQPHMPPEAPDIRTLLLGSVLGFLCHQRGVLPLRAACVEVDGRAVVLAGGAAAGKSTLAAAFWRRGHRVLTDNIAVVDFSSKAGPRVLPTFPRLRLWRDFLDEFDLRVDGLEPIRAAPNKYNVPIQSAFCSEALPLAGVYKLEPVHNRRHAGFAVVRGADAMFELTRIVYRRMMAIDGGRQPAMMAALIRLACLPVTQLRWVTDLKTLDTAVDEIVARQRMKSSAAEGHLGS